MGEYLKRAYNNIPVEEKPAIKWKKIFYTIFIFTFGVIIGWLNPIEGPLDWTYDEYASQPAHKSPAKVAPLIKENPIYIWFFIKEEDEELYTIQAIKEE